jgi:hypothetical protein
MTVIYSRPLAVVERFGDEYLAVMACLVFVASSAIALRSEEGIFAKSSRR